MPRAVSSRQKLSGYLGPNVLVGACQRFDYIPNRNQEIAEGGAQSDAICGLARDTWFGQPALLGLPETIVVLFVRDELV
jgi:hypothetical protein